MFKDGGDPTLFQAIVSNNAMFKEGAPPAVVKFPDAVTKSVAVSYVISETGLLYKINKDKMKISIK
jgi:hypothetical protein